MEFPCLFEVGTGEADLFEGGGEVGLEESGILLVEESCGPGAGLEEKDITKEGDIEEEEEGG